MSRHIPAELRRRVRQHFAEQCAYCHTAERLTVVTFEVEHVLPVASGGESVFENLCLACPMCNRHKAARSSAIDSESGLQAEFFHPHRQPWKDHFAWTVDGSQLVGLTPVGRATIEALRMNRPQLVRTRRLWIALKEHPPQFDG